MNWLIYIGGGWLYFLLWFKTIYGRSGEKDTLAKTLSILLTSTMLWIWICWRFIK